MNKHMRLLLLGITASLGLTLGASAEFNKINTYKNGTFTDVADPAWYSESVKNAYEFGIMQGDSASTFSPEGNLTVAEGITIAARIHETMNGTEIKEADGEWYKMYVDYAVENEIMEEDTFSDYNVKIKRSEMAILLANVCGELPTINDVEKIADINEKAPYYNDVLSLYSAGILTGNDEYGNFAPGSNLTRAEMATMAVRIADKNRRVNKTFEELNVRTYSDGYFLIDNVLGTGRTNNNIANGWDYDNRFEMGNTSGWGKKYVADSNNTIFTALKRDFEKESEGTLTLELMTEMWSRNGGLYVAFENDKEERLFGITERNGNWLLYGAEELETDIPAPNVLTLVSVKANIDLDENTMCVYIDNRVAGEVKIPDGAVVERLVLGTNEIGTGSVNITHVKLIKNYAVIDRFPATDKNIGEIPLDYVTRGDFTIQKMNTGEESDVYSVKGQVKGGETGYAIRSFEPICGNVDVKTHILLPEASDGASISLLAAGSEVITLYTKDSKFYINNTELKSFHRNIWQDIHIESNTETGEALIRICGQIVATVPFDASYIDGVKYSLSPVNDAEMWFDDLEIQCYVEHDDYVPVPQKPESDYLVGMYSCYLWRDTVSGEGWDSVSSFPEFEPLLGYYDEGLRETADWELKQMIEHGVDFMMHCWFAPDANVTQPIKRTDISHEAIHSGFLNAKYSDMMEYSIMWETAYQGCRSFEQFKEYIWNYWVDYYFTDARYLRSFDNKLVLWVYVPDFFETAFGGEEGAEEAVIWMNAEAKKLGYDGLLLLVARHLHEESFATPLVKYGFDGIGFGSLGTNGNNAVNQIDQYEKNDLLGEKYNLIHLPIVSPGYNDIGRNNRRTALISIEDHLKVCEYIKEQLDKRNTGTFADRTVLIDGWNEYSEGHIVAPTKEWGYDYLDNIRNVFTNGEKEHEELDIEPTPEQKARITHLYPDKHSPIRWFMFEGSDSGKGIGDDSLTSGANALEYVKWDMATEEGLKAWDRGHGLSEYVEADGKISATSEGDSSIIAHDLDIDISEADILHIRMESDKNYWFQVYFATEDNPGLGENKKVTGDTYQGERDYYINMGSNENWTGVLNTLRIDPINSEGKFSVSLIEIMKSRDVPDIVINGYDFPTVFEPVITDDGDYEVAAEATIRGFFSTMRVYHEWDRFTDDGVLTVKTRDNKTLVFRVGSDKVVVDGVEKALGYTFKLRDGLPVFHIKKLCDLLGYEYTETPEALNIKSATDEEIAIYEAQSSAAAWDYRILTEAGDWRTRQSSISVVDGFLNLVPTDTDSSITKTVDFNADDYTHALIGLKYTEGAENWIVNLFFATDSVGISSNTCLVGWVKDHMEGVAPGEIIEVKLDMTSNQFWAGRVSTIRFDPHWRMEPVFIQYIKFIKDEENASSQNEEKIIVDDTPPVELELTEADIVDSEYGLLLGEINFDGENGVYAAQAPDSHMISDASYINSKYIDGFDMTIHAPLSALTVSADSLVPESNGKLLDIVPNGTAVYRFGINVKPKGLLKGRYTITADLYTPEGSADYGTFRMDIIGEGPNSEAANANTNKGKWHKAVWHIDVLAVKDGKATVSDGNVTKNINVSELTGANLWVTKFSDSTEQHYYYDNIRVFYDPGTLGTGYVDPNAPVELEITENDTVHKKFGLLLGEICFNDKAQLYSAEPPAAHGILEHDYVNEKYMDKLTITIHASKSYAGADGIAVGADEGYVLDVVPNGSNVYRLGLETSFTQIMKGKYTFAMDTYMPAASTDYGTFRFDTIGEGSNDQADVVKANKGKWVTVYWTMDVQQINGDKAVVYDGIITKTVPISSLTAGNLWITKSSAADQHYYYDNFRVYFDNGKLDTDPDMKLEAGEVVIERIITEDNAYIAFDGEDIVDEEYGVLLGECSFDYSHQIGSEVLRNTGADGLVKASYVNGNYMSDFDVSVHGAASDVVDGSELKKDNFVMDIVPNGTAAHRVSIGIPGLTLRPGTYTFTLDVCVGYDSGNLTLVRFDILGDVEGHNSFAEPISKNKGSWYTAEWSFEVTASEDGKVFVTHNEKTKEMSTSGFQSVHMWLSKSGASVSDHYYYDNLRLYYKSAE